MVTTSFASELGRINSILNNRNSEWTDIVKVLATLQELSSTDPNFAVRSQDITDLRYGLTLLIKDSRSRVVRETCDTISIMASNLKNSFEPVSQFIFFECLDKVSSSTNGSVFQKVCKDVVQNVVMRRFIPSLLMYIEKRPEKTAQTAIQCLEIVISKWPVNIINQYQQAIVDALCKGVNSYSPSVRSTSKAIITACKTQFPDMKRLFLLNLSSKDRYLIEDSTAPSPTRSIQSSSSRSFLINGVSYQLNQPVHCRLSNGVYRGVIKYIGKPDNRTLRVGVVFSQFVGSKHNGVLNGVRLFDCSPGYGAVITPSQIETVEARNRSVRGAAQSPSGMATSPVRSQGSSLSQTPQAPQSPTYASYPQFALQGKCSVEDCVAFHKLMIYNALQDFRSELQMLEDLESRKMDPKAIEAYRNDMEFIITKRQREESDFVTKLARVSV